MESGGGFLHGVFAVSGLSGRKIELGGSPEEFVIGIVIAVGTGTYGRLELFAQFVLIVVGIGILLGPEICLFGSGQRTLGEARVIFS